MNAFKRISLSLTAQMNSLIDQIENHEAVAESVLDEIRSSLLSLKYQIKRIQSETASFDKRISQGIEQKAVWEDRARRLPEADRERALECVRRMKQAGDEIASLTEQRESHVALEKQLLEQAKKIESRFTELKAKQSQFAGRQSRAEAANKLASYECTGVQESVFDRWEKHIMRGEAGTEMCLEPTDTLAREFNEAEEREALEAMLTDLKSKQ